jgi:DNA mismatch endonuclease (patch repair protein)
VVRRASRSRLRDSLNLMKSISRPKHGRRNSMGRGMPGFARPDKHRSANMRAIQSNGNLSTEWRLRSLLIRNGVCGWNIRSKEFLGTPDFAFPRAGVVVFIDGCFWHGCPTCGHIPKTNEPYWVAKIGRNKRRDKKYSRELRRQGFKVIRIWECALRAKPQRCLQRILAAVS